eukprot:6186653-Pleurochrysis_carterae.AAC.1
MRAHAACKQAQDVSVRHASAMIRGHMRQPHAGVLQACSMQRAAYRRAACKCAACKREHATFA